MDWESIGIISGILVTLVGAVWHLSSKITQIETKLDIVWAAILDRGLASMVEKGLASINSPVLLTDEVVSWFSEFVPQLRGIRKKFPKYNDYQLALEIQKSLGDKILREICIKYKVHNMECLNIAVAVAKS